MNNDAELLNYVYRNSQMGVNTIDKLLDMTTCDEFRKHLESQHNEYGEINLKAKELLNSNGYEEKGLSKIAKIKTDVMMEFETLKDKSVSHIAEMLIVGSNMGVINAIKKMKEFPNAEKEITSLMNRLKTTEERNLKELQNFL